MAKGILRNARSQHWYKMAKKELDTLGISDWDIVPPTGKGHPKLVIKHDGKTFKTPVPCSERSCGDHSYIVQRIRNEFARAA